MIQHTVAFRLRHSKGSAEEAAFLDQVRKLRNIPGVIDFRLLRQVGSRNDFRFGLSMYFMSAQTYREYNEHAAHQHFVNTLWNPEVEDFLEIDYTELD